jgi:hypothetical protein
MSRQAERERRARVIAADGEFQASEKLSQPLDRSLARVGSLRRTGQDPPSIKTRQSQPDG